MMKRATRPITKRGFAFPIASPGFVLPITRRGFVLPVVLIAVALTTAVGGALVMASFRASRGARLAWNGDVALHAADEALAQAAANWSPARVANLAVGARVSTSTTTTSGATVQLEILRVSTTQLWIEAEAWSSNTISALRARRRIARMVTIDVSGIDIPAALTALGTLGSTAPPSIDARGTAPDGETTCGTLADSGNTTALITNQWLTPDSSGMSGTPRTRSITTSRADSLRQQLWNRLQSVPHVVQEVTTATVVQPELAGALCTPASGEPRRGVSALAACTSQWPLRVLHASDGTVVLNASRHQGALVIDGNLVLHGTLEVRGLLIVRGNIDASAGGLRVTGAAILLQQNGGTSQLGDDTDVRYSRCALLRAVTPLALIGPPPVFAWADRS